MSRSGVEQLLYLVDRAFDKADDQAHSILSNLVDVRDEDWRVKPAGGDRSISEIAEHIGECKFMYSNHAFGDGKMSWHDFDARNADPPSKAAMIDWLRQGHAGLRTDVAGLDDDDLLVPRKANLSKSYETRWLIATMIEHYLYHAGEINHIRALLQDNDAWPNY